MGTKIRAEKHKNIIFCTSKIENLFINEFLPEAPGDFVKVFVYGLMYAQYEQEIDLRKTANILGLSENDLEGAWKYWEAKGLVELTGSGDDLEVQYLSQLDNFFGKGISSKDSEIGSDTDEDSEISEKLTDHQLALLYAKYQDVTGRTVSRSEANKLTDTIRTYNIDPEVMEYAIGHCAEKGVDRIDYICKVAVNWAKEGARDMASVTKMQKEQNARNRAYRSVFTELGFSRKVTPSDKPIMDRWFDEMGFKLEDVIDACRSAAGKREVSLNYIDKILENRMLEKGGVNTRPDRPSYYGNERKENVTSSVPAEGTAKVSRRVLREYYDYIREKDDETRKARVEETKSKIKGLRKLFDEEMEVNSLVVRILPGPAAKEKRESLKGRRQEIEDRKKALLRKNGYPEDYTDRKYRCRTCRDTGYTDSGMICTCAKTRAEEAFKWNQERIRQKSMNPGTGYSSGKGGTGDV